MTTHTTHWSRYICISPSKITNSICYFTNNSNFNNHFKFIWVLQILLILHTFGWSLNGFHVVSRFVGIPWKPYYSLALEGGSLLHLTLHKHSLHLYFFPFPRHFHAHPGSCHPRRWFPFDFYLYVCYAPIAASPKLSIIKWHLQSINMSSFISVPLSFAVTQETSFQHTLVSFC